MIIDDSAVFRSILKRLLNGFAHVEVIALAEHGQDALDKLDASPELANQCDLILLDLQMPVMSGYEVLPELQKRLPKKHIILISSTNEKDARHELNTLANNAVDYLAKPSSMQSGDDRDHFSDALHNRIKMLRGESPGEMSSAQEAAKKIESAAARAQPDNPAVPLIKTSLSGFSPRAIAIGASTGGPHAITELFKILDGKHINIPVFITVHMPKHFTTLFAQNLEQQTGYQCKEASDGEKVLPGMIYLAPGDYHMECTSKGAEIALQLTQTPPENFCRPAVDPMLRSLARIYGKHLLTIILTGMGSDGMLGSRVVVEKGGIVLAQDAETSVVWGMPGAVTQDGLCTSVLPLHDLGNSLKGMVG